MTDFAAAATALDAADPLSGFRDEFVENHDVVAYFDGNSLGRPTRRAAELLDEFVHRAWGGRLIRGWTDGWLTWPEQLGNRLGAAALGAAPGQVVVADSTSVLLYKLARAAVTHEPSRTEIVLHRDDFPTDRYLLEGIAAERGLTLRWIEPEGPGVTPEQVAQAVSERTALVVLSQVAYLTAWIADAAAITEIAHRAGALMLWDLSHAAGVTDVQLDAWNADLAVGCGYKFLNGGPGAPAFAYVRADLQERLHQPITGWFGQHDQFEMGQGYAPAPGVRRFLSGTPPILAMVPLLAGIELIEQAGIGAIREKSLALTSFAIELADAWLAPLGATVLAIRDPERRGAHLTVQHPQARALLDPLWAAGVIPDFRNPNSLRLGLSPLSTSFTEVHTGLQIIRESLASAR